jgi:hypothetical protein
MTTEGEVIVVGDVDGHTAAAREVLPFGSGEAPS